MSFKVKGNWSQIIEFLEELLAEVEKMNIRRLKAYNPSKALNSPVTFKATCRAEAQSLS